MKQQLHWRVLVLMLSIIWAVQGIFPDKNWALYKESEYEAGAIHKGVKIVEVRPWQYVTAVRLASAHLKLIVWRLDPGGNNKNLVRQGDYKAGRIAEDGIALYSRGDGKVFTAVRLRDDRLKLIQWQVSSGGQITRLSDSYAGELNELTREFDYDEVSHVGITGLPPQTYAVIGGSTYISQNLVVAARLKDSGNLKLYNFRGLTIRGVPQPLQQGDSYMAGSIHASTFNHDIAISWAEERYVITAVRLASENLKMIGWSIDSDGKIVREGSMRAGRIQGVSLTRGPNGELTTACRLLDGALKVIGWSMQNGIPVRKDDLKTNEYVTQIIALPTEWKGTNFVTALQHDQYPVLQLSKFSLVNGTYEQQETGYSSIRMKEISVAQSFTGTSSFVWSYAVTAGQKWGTDSTSPGNLLLEVWNLGDASSGPGGWSFEASLFQQSLEQILDGNVVGYAFALNSAHSHRSSANGSAVTAIDTDPGQGAIPWTLDRRMNGNSIAKTITAVATLQLLRKNGLDFTSPIGPWLPSDWIPDSAASALRFVDLLKHETGYQSGDTTPTWDEIENRFSVAPNGTLGSYSYNNSNYGLLRVLIPGLWRAADPEPWKGMKITEGNHALNYILYVNQYIFEPLGIPWVECTPQNEDPTLWYDVNSPGTPGFNSGDWTQVCGSGGWYLSAQELATFLHGIATNPWILTSDDRDLMDANHLGWTDPDNNASRFAAAGSSGSNFTEDDYFVHGGRLRSPSDSSIVGRSCIGKFPLNVQVALHMNSLHTGGIDQCAILIQAYESALVQW